MKSLKIALTIAAAFVSVSPSFAASAARLQVSAIVSPFLSFQATQQVASFKVGMDEIERGYVDIPGALALSVRTNLKEGVPVLVENEGPAKISVKETGTAAFGDGPFTVSTANIATGSLITKRYDARVELPLGTRPGLHPFHLLVTPAL